MTAADVHRPGWASGRGNGNSVGVQEGRTRMDSDPLDSHDHPEQRGFAAQSKAYTTKKLRGAAVMYAPAVVLDLFEGISVLATAFGKLPDPQRNKAARILRLIITAGALLPWVYLLIVRPWHLSWGGHRRGRAQEPAGRRPRAPPDA